MTYSLSDTRMYDLIDSYANDNAVDLNDQSQIDEMYNDLVQWLEMELQNYVDDMIKEEEDESYTDLG